MFQTHFISGNTEEKNFFRCYTNMLAKNKSLSKKMYYYSELANNKENLH